VLLKGWVLDMEQFLSSHQSKFRVEGWERSVWVPKYSEDMD
jgi:hypothetical protein